MTNGQWVTFTLRGALPGQLLNVIHERAGKLVGIYRKSGIDAATGFPTPECIAPVEKGSGRNVRYLPSGRDPDDRSDAPILDFAMDAVTDVEAAALDDVPVGRLATANPKWLEKMRPKE